MTPEIRVTEWYFTQLDTTPEGRVVLAERGVEDRLGYRLE